MDINEPGVKFHVVWHDDDLLEFRVSAASGTFSGETKIYLAYAEAAEFARGLTGFPATIMDRREFEFEHSAAGNRISLLFTAPGVHVNIIDAEDSGQSAHIVIPIEAAAIDTFLRHFAATVRDRVGTAFLIGR